MKIHRALKLAGEVLLRQRKHQIWRLPDGRNYIIATTPGDWRAEQNQLTDLRRMLRAKQ